MPTTHPDLTTTAVLPAYEAPACLADTEPVLLVTRSDIETARVVRDCRTDRACRVTVADVPAVSVLRSLKLDAGTHPVVTDADLARVTR